jgi:hypothetical protein
VVADVGVVQVTLPGVVGGAVVVVVMTNVTVVMVVMTDVAVVVVVMADVKVTQLKHCLDPPKLFTGFPPVVL